MSGALLRPPWCRACRSNILRSLTAFAGVPIPATASSSRIPSLSRSPQKSFSVFHAPLSEQNPPGSPNGLETPPTASDSEQQDGTPATTQEHVPWYLQVETPDLPQAPQAARQDIPPLPDNPPPILEDMLKHISVDIGLDDLILYDLRKLDPPPALGANLIMVIGTARSVKHLNVSADRFSRWLRSTYKLKPDADGLLGRNELKIKLRRKARRAKLASNAGATQDNHDDGITTGWICVNAGVVDDGQSDAVNKQRNDKFVGFGEVSEGTRIVVQMLTEEKRADIDLEGLWAHAINRKSRNDNRNSGSRLDAPSEEVGAARDKQAMSPSDRDLRATHRLHNRIDKGQIRAMHTRRQLHSSNTTLQTDRSDSNVNPSQPNGRERNARNPKTSTASSATPSTLLFQFLSDLPENEALKQLGQGPDDRNSTQFLNMFYEALSQDGDSTFALSKLELSRRAIVLHHQGYTKDSLFEQFHECILSGYDISEEQMWQIMDTLLLPRPQGAHKQSPIIHIPEAEIDLALKVLDHMSLRGMNVLTGRTLSSLYRAASFQVPVHVRGAPRREGTIKPILVEPQAWENTRTRQIALEKAIDAGNIRLEPDDFLNLLRGEFNQGSHTRFLLFWRKIALLGYPRSEKLYSLFFMLQAERGNQRNCLSILSTWPLMMQRENPPVPLRGELAKAILACIHVADPDIKQNVKENPRDTLPSLWRRCVRNLRAEQL